MPQIHKLGKEYEGSIVKFVKNGNTYRVELISKGNGKYNEYLALCTEKSPKGAAKIPKMWGYV